MGNNLDINNTHETLAHRFEKQSRTSPKKAAIILDETITSYGDLDKLVQFYINEFKKLEANGRFLTNRQFAICLKNSPDIPAVFIAASVIGLNCQILNPDWPAERIQNLLAYLKTSYLISKTDEQQLRSNQNQSECVSKNDASPDLPLYTGFTSGSTGLPKGFIRSQTSWLKSFQADQEIFNFHEDDVILAPGSLAHSLSLYATIRGIFGGMTTLLSSVFRPDKCITQIRNFSASILYLTPVQIRSILDYLTSKAPSDLQELATVRLILSSGAKFPEAWIKEVEAFFPNAKIIEFYGTSELSYISYNHLHVGQPSGLVGKPFPGVNIKIDSQDNQREQGPIRIKSDFIFDGYAAMGGIASRENCDLVDGYLSVGDTGYLDDEGNLYIKGRADRIFLSSGRNISPEEIETILQSHPDIEHAAIFPKEDARKENTILAILKWDQRRLDHQQIKRVLRSLLATYQIPKDIYTLDVWPKTVSDKTDLQALKAALEDNLLEKIK